MPASATARQPLRFFCWLAWAGSYFTVRPGLICRKRMDRQKTMGLLTSGESKVSVLDIRHFSFDFNDFLPYLPVLSKFLSDTHINLGYR